MRPMPQSSGDLIKQARLARVWTQQDLAHKTGLSYKTIWAAEADAGVRPKTLQKIAKALGIDLDLLMERAS